MVALLVCAVVVTAATTAYETVPLGYVGGAANRTAPDWSRPCMRRNPNGSRYVLPCGRVRGLIVYREGHDPDGDGDVHGVALAGARLVVLKARPALPRSAEIPGVGHRVDLAGPEIDGKWGLTTIDVRRSAPLP